MEHNEVSCKKQIHTTECLDFLSICSHVFLFISNFVNMDLFPPLLTNLAIGFLKGPTLCFLLLFVCFYFIDFSPEFDYFLHLLFLDFIFLFVPELSCMLLNY